MSELVIFAIGCLCGWVIYSINAIIIILALFLAWRSFSSKRRSFNIPEELPKNLLDAGNKWDVLTAIEQHVGASRLRSCYDMVKVHEQITLLDPEYVNLFTVQHNLFAGALLSLSANPEHIQIAESAKEGKIRGAFALTEQAAGVYSGAIVNTAVRREGDHFVLHTPDEDADKVWISYAADPEVTYLVVFGKFVDADSKDKHNKIVVPLLIPKSLPGITVTPYVTDQRVFKLNSFGRINFNQVQVPFSALMDKFVTWDTATNRFCYEGSRRHLLDKLFDRLFVGRLCLSGSCLTGMHSTTQLVIQHAKKKEFWDNLEVRNKLQGFEQEAAVMQQRLYEASKLLDAGTVKPYQVNLLKARIPVRSLAVVSELGMYLGGRTIRQDCPVIGLHGVCYGGVVAEGDSQIMRQICMKDVMLTPWLVSWDPLMWLFCLLAVLKIKLGTLVLRQDMKTAWNHAQPLLGAAFDRIRL